MLHLEHHREPVSLDALVVLGRGIKQNGELTQTGFERAEIAAELAQTAFGSEPGLVVFTGGRSWRQALHGVVPPSEGGSMLRHALEVGSPPPPNVTYLAEEESESTFANLILSRPLLQPAFNRATRPRIGFISDDLHFAYGRVQYATKLVLPEVHGYAIRIPRNMQPDDITEEKNTTRATRFIMQGVRRGNLDAIMRRQLLLEKANRMARRVIHAKPYEGEVAAPVEHETSYRHVERFSAMTPAVLSGYLVGRL